MKNKISIIILVVIILLFNVSYANTIDLENMDYLFNKVRQADTFEKNLYIDLFSGIFQEDYNLEMFAQNLPDYLTAEELDLLENAGYSEKEIVDNIRTLKVWSVADRMKLLDLGLMTDQVAAKNELEKLNSKYSTSDSEISNNTSDDTSDIPIIPEEETTESIERNKALISKPLVVVNKDRSFQDIQGHWSKEYIDFFAIRDVINGRSEQTFEPDALIKESEIIKLLMEITIENPDLLEISETSLSEGLNDQWYSVYIKQAKALGILNEVNIVPDEYPTREKIIYLFIETLKMSGFQVNEDLLLYKGGFTDFDTTTPQFRQAIIIANNLGIINGNENGTLTPKREITRGETTKILYGFYKVIINGLN